MRALRAGSSSAPTTGPAAPSRRGDPGRPVRDIRSRRRRARAGVLRARWYTPTEVQPRPAARTALTNVATTLPVQGRHGDRRQRRDPGRLRADARDRAESDGSGNYDLTVTRGLQQHHARQARRQPDRSRRRHRSGIGTAAVPRPCTIRHRRRSRCSPGTYYGGICIGATRLHRHELHADGRLRRAPTAPGAEGRSPRSPTRSRRSSPPGTPSRTATSSRSTARHVRALPAAPRRQGDADGDARLPRHDGGRARQRTRAISKVERSPADVTSATARTSSPAAASGSAAPRASHAPARDDLQHERPGRRDGLRRDRPDPDQHDRDRHARPTTTGTYAGMTIFQDRA